MKFKVLKEGKREFFDYHTGEVDLLKGDVIDTKTTGVSDYNFLLPHSDQKEYMRKEKNLVGKIVYMTPQEYYEQCSLYGFPGKVVPVEKLKRERRYDAGTLEHLKAVLTEYGRKFPLPYINIAEKGQEGLHRMMVIGDMFGWTNAKYPVLIVEYADEERAKQENENKIINKHSNYISRAIRQTLQYKFTDLEEVKEQLQFDLDREFQYVDEVAKPVQFTLEEDPTDDNYYIVKVGKAQSDIEKDLIKFIEPKSRDTDLDIEDELDLDDIELEETEDFLRRYFGDNWRETHPYLKDTFNIKEEYIEHVDIKQMDEYIQNYFGQSLPGDGCLFIAPNGQFINIYPTLDDHEDLCYWLEENGFDETPGDAEWFVDEFSYIKCRDSNFMPHVNCPEIITSRQYISLEEWMDTKVKYGTNLEIVMRHDNQYTIKRYNTEEYFPEDLIKIIKRYYSSGKLYEAITDLNLIKETPEVLLTNWRETNLHLKDTFGIKESFEKEIPRYLYHATYKNRWNSIKRTGGLKTHVKKRYWEDSRNVICMSEDPYVAESYAETSDEASDYELSNIVILKIDTSVLDINYLNIDGNIIRDEDDKLENTEYEYSKDIPLSAISLFNTDQVQDSDIDYESRGT